ncbi:MAG: hypothetical protein EXX96DRAFT_582964 [Benjaminiella poitrasii]|nr:MAG: hypothetical protein EXX96DRAFT_582964 [Benjaminiella poitrasii]
MTRSSPWTDLSSELLHLIFSSPQLSTQDLFHCQLVCQTWSRIAHRILYSHLYLSPTTLPLLIDTLTTFEDIGPFVKQITLPYTKSLGYLLDLFGQYCPNAERITLSAAPDPSYWTGLVRGLQRGHWRRLKQIMLPLSASDEPSFIEAVVALRASLEELVLDIDSTTTNTYNAIWTHLTDFISLKRLDLHRTTQTGNLFELEHMLNAGLASTVSTVTFGTYTETTFYLDDSIWLSHNNLTETLTPCPYITSLDINTVVTRAEALLYIAHKFPNLTRLSLNNRCDHLTKGVMYFYGWFDVPLRFIDYLKTIQTVELTLMASNLDCVLTRLLLDHRQSYDSIKFFISLKHQIIHDDQVLRFDPIVKIQKRQSQVTVMMYFMAGDKSLELIQYYLQRFGAVMDQLEIRHARVLDAVLKHCSSLETLHLAADGAIESLDQSLKTANTSIQRLTLEDCVMSEQVYDQLSSQLPHLKRLEIISKS